MSSPAIDLDAYFARIGYLGSRAATLSTLHGITAAHSQSIPFENLDVLLERRIRLDAESLQRKLIRNRRGGYCFEQNGLLLLALSALGFCVTPISARVRLQRPRDYTPARTHVFLRVEVEGGSWLTDVGVGGLSLTSAIRLVEDVEQPTPHEARRIVREGVRLFHQARLGDEWSDICEFTLEEMPLIDREIANWYTSTHPESHFKNRLIVARAMPSRARVTLADDELSIRDAQGRAQKRRLASQAELRAALNEHFGVQLPEGTDLPYAFR